MNRLPAILMKYHALFVIFEKKGSKILNCRLLQIISRALRIKFGFFRVTIIVSSAYKMTFILPKGLENINP